MALALPGDRGGLRRIGVGNKRITDILCGDAAVLTVSWVLSQCFSLLLLNLCRCSLKLSFQPLPLLPEILCCSSSVCAPLSCFVDTPSQSLGSALISFCPEHQSVSSHPACHLSPSPSAHRPTRSLRPFFSHKFLLEFLSNHMTLF